MPDSDTGLQTGASRRRTPSSSTRGPRRHRTTSRNIAASSDGSPLPVDPNPTLLTLTMPGVPGSFDESTSMAEGDHTVDLETRMAELAVEIGLASSDTIDECLRVLAAEREHNPDIPLTEILIEREVLTISQVQMLEDTLREEQGNSLGRIGGFQLLEKLGEGGMGTVYRAKQLTLDRIVALKILPERLAQNREFVTRFEREVKAAAKLDHTNVVRAFDAGKVGGKYYFAMEFIQGKSLERVIRERGALPEADAIGIAIQAARGLEAAWRSNLVHRDIKPDNILMTEDDVAKIADLGLAREIAGAVGANLTQDGTAIGTPHYISPEQARGKTVDIRSDIFSLGVTLYRTVTGVYPYNGKEPIAIIMSRFRTTPKTVKEVRKDLSEDLSKVIETMMSMNRKYRYPDPAVLLHDLDLLAAGKRPQFASDNEGARKQALEAAKSRQMSSAAFTVVEQSHRSVFWLLLGTALLVAAGFGAAVYLIPETLMRTVPSQLAPASAQPQQSPPPEDERAKAEQERLRKLTAEAKAVYAAASDLYQQERYEEAIKHVDEAGDKYAATEHGPRLDSVRGRAAAAIDEKLRSEQERAERAKQHHEILKLARDELKLKDYVRAMDLLVQAKAIDDSKEVADLFSEAKRLQFIARATAYENEGRLADALSLYESANKIERSRETDGRIAELERRLALRSALANAEALANETKWREADKAYARARDIADEIEAREIDELLVPVKREILYLDLLQEAGSHLEREEFKDALTDALEAGKIKSDAAEPKQVAAEARRGIGPEKRTTNSIGMEFCLVPAGIFKAGSDTAEEDEGPAHKVYLDAYYIGKLEVTNTQFELFEPTRKARRTEYSPGDNTPVVGVSWHDAVAFCDWLTKKEGIRYRLPTEAEWEKAARGPDGRPYPWGRHEPGRNDAWPCNCACGEDQDDWDADGYQYASPVGSYSGYASPYGALDMAGNVWEWCKDWYRVDYYKSAAQKNPSGPPLGRQRVLRGGSFANSALDARTTRRTAHTPALTEACVGFRCMREVESLLISPPAEEAQR